MADFKIEYSDVKLVANGHVLEVYRYEKPVCSNFEGQGGRRRKDAEESKRAREIRRTSCNKARNEVRRKVLANFNEHSKFVTLTFREDIRDVQTANKYFKKFMQRLRYRYKGFKYLAVIEFTKEGRVHYHMISDLPYIPNKDLAEIWSNGFVKINDIRGVDNVGAYMIKYMLKDLDDERLKGNKAYLCSKGLKTSSVVRGNIVERVLKSYGITEESKKVFESSYTSEHHGNVSYTEYNLKRL